MNTSAARARAFFVQCRISRLSSGSGSWKRGLCTSPASRSLTAARSIEYTPISTSVDDSVELPARKKQHYVTAPVFYTDDAPDLGHMFSMVIADVFTRWQSLRDGDKEHQSQLLIATDEHGLKVQRAAAKANVIPRTFCDYYAGQFKRLADAADIKYDRFIRTTDADHKATVEHFWRELNHLGYIYESKHEGWYSVNDETFHPESQIHLVLEPRTGKKMYASMETGNAVEWTSEINYMFRLSKFQQPLLKHYKDNPDFVVPQAKMQLIIKEVESGLEDISISRSSSRVPWGISVPTDSSQTIYVWLDALLSCLTMTGYPSASKLSPGGLWPPDLQVIGKDVTRFHAIYWPAFLMAVESPIPKQILVHERWTMNREKMSKALGNVVDPFHAIGRFGVDAMRFFMIHNGPFEADENYDNSWIQYQYQSKLQRTLGSLINHVIRGKVCSVKEALEYEIPTDVLLELGEKHNLLYFRHTRLSVGAWMTRRNPRLALRRVEALVVTTNKYFHNMKPWDLIKGDKEGDKELARQVIYICAESIRIACILLQPVMPSSMTYALDCLGVDPEKRTFEYAEPNADREYGSPLPGIDLSVDEVVFPPLQTED